MPLISSISGIRGTIGGEPGNNLTPLDLIKFLNAYVVLLKQKFPHQKTQVVIGRDGRISGKIIKDFAISTLNLLGVDVIDIDLATTPTVEMEVVFSDSQGGIIISASHNPAQWNALKLLNDKGEFLSQADGQKMSEIIFKSEYIFSDISSLGSNTRENDALRRHISRITALSSVLRENIGKRKFKVVADAINSVGALAIPELLDSLGVSDYVIINREMDGRFSHDPEPLDKNLSEIKERVIKEGADLGIVVDPDVDRLAFIDEQGNMFGEEYTLVSVADYIFKNFKNEDGFSKSAISNLSSTRALSDLASQCGGEYFASAVGEVNVVEKMKEKKAVIGGEGNGGIIYPPLHYGRDALVGIALFLSHLAIENIKVSELRRKYVSYEMIKDKMELDSATDVNILLEKLAALYNDYEQSTIDGLKIDFPDYWLHIRPSNTEPIVRIYAEAKSFDKAQDIVNDIKDKIKEIRGV